MKMASSRVKQRGTLVVDLLLLLVLMLVPQALVLISLVHPRLQPLILRPLPAALRKRAALWPSCQAIRGMASCPSACGKKTRGQIRPFRAASVSQANALAFWALPCPALSALLAAAGPGASWTLAPHGGFCLSREEALPP